MVYCFQMQFCVLSTCCNPASEHGHKSHCTPDKGLAQQERPLPISEHLQPTVRGSSKLGSVVLQYGPELSTACTPQHAMLHYSSASHVQMVKGAGHCLVGKVHLHWQSAGSSKPKCINCLRAKSSAVQYGCMWQKPIICYAAALR